MKDEAAIERQLQDKGLNAPRLTPEHIDSVIVGEYFLKRSPDQPSHHAVDCLTICVLVLQNGFTVTGESACASPENFNAEIRRDIARANARNKIWQLEGYLLREKLHQAEQCRSFAGVDENTF